LSVREGGGGVVKRERAVELAEYLLSNLLVGQYEWPLSR
jgi:hypothetical protein